MASATTTLMTIPRAGLNSNTCPTPSGTRSTTNRANTEQKPTWPGEWTNGSDGRGTGCRAGGVAVLPRLHRFGHRADAGARHDAHAARRGGVVATGDRTVACGVTTVDSGRQSHGRRGPRRSRALRSRARFGGSHQRCDLWKRSSCTRRAQHAGHQDRRVGDGHVAGRETAAPQGSEIGMMKRMTWFVGGAVAGAAGVTVGKRKIKQAANQLTPKPMVNGLTNRVHDAYVEAVRAMRTREVELRGRMDGTATSLADDLDEGDSVLVDGRPVEPGQVIVLKQVRDRGRDWGRRRA